MYTEATSQTQAKVSCNVMTTILSLAGVRPNIDGLVTNTSKAGARRGNLAVCNDPITDHVYTEAISQTQAKQVRGTLAAVFWYRVM